MAHKSHPKLPIAELLAKEGLLTPDQIGRVLIAQQEQYPSLPLGQVCIELGLMSALQLSSVLSQHTRRLFLGELLVHTGAITQSQLKAALTLQKKLKPRKKLGDILIENDWINRRL